MLLVVTVTFGITLASAWGVVWLLGRFVSARLAIGAALALMAYLLYTGIDTMLVCSAEATYVAPLPGNSGEGSMIHACDGPGGMIAYFYSVFLVPTALVLLGVVTYRHWISKAEQKVQS
ncbi:hypothetical protein [Rhizobium sp. RU36D]|uniref:hypothetical protein n=1 Tax=Rhizobium sp. RU36D TaxID=1907415 RepID=UPI0009D7AA0C|nr:hypothetical protein [Rhizobium sp. RU36D]SMC39504.1 hypothetical protein SAMN05880593_10128 [Rhizobium sp. RU36D]